MGSGRLRGAVTTIEHTRHLAGVAQAAARTRALRVSFVCYDFHLLLPLWQRTATSHHRRATGAAIRTVDDGNFRRLFKPIEQK